MADALTHVLLKANYPFVISECELLLDTLACFIEDFDSCLVQVLSELCKQFKHVTDYIRTHHEDRLGDVSLASNFEEAVDPACPRETDLDEEDEIARMLISTTKL